MNKRLTPEEAFVEKRFKQDNFRVIKLDNTNKYKAPDFKISKNNTTILVEVKIGFKKGQILETLSTGAFRFDPAPAVEDYFREVAIKHRDYIFHNPKDRSFPYILVFISPFFIDNELEWSEKPYKKYKMISAVFTPRRVHPLDNKADEMTLGKLEEIINSTEVPFNSQTRLGWDIIKNPYALNPIKTPELASVFVIKRPMRN